MSNFIGPLLINQNLSTDRQGASAIVESYRWTGPDRLAAFADPDCPQTGSPHPTLPKLTADRVEAFVDVSGTVIVQVSYSNDRRFTSTKPNVNNETYYKWGWDQATVITRVPLYVFTPVGAVPPPGSNISNSIWKATAFQIKSYRVRRPLTMQVRIANVNELDSIAEQTDKIHTLPGGGDHLFLGGTVDFIEGQPGDAFQTVRVTYTWEKDLGTLYPELPADPAQRSKLSWGAQAAAGGVLRLPYHTLSVVNAENPLTTVPTTVMIRPYTLEPDGWRTLPGMVRVR